GSHQACGNNRLLVRATREPARLIRLWWRRPQRRPRRGPARRGAGAFDGSWSLTSDPPEFRLHSPRGLLAGHVLGSGCGWGFAFGCARGRPWPDPAKQLPVYPLERRLSPEVEASVPSRLTICHEADSHHPLAPSSREEGNGSLVLLLAKEE